MPAPKSRILERIYTVLGAGSIEQIGVDSVVKLRLSTMDFEAKELNICGLEENGFVSQLFVNSV